MANKRAYDELFIKGTIQTVSKMGIENTRTKDVAEYAGFSEAAMYRRFPTKEILLRESFIYIDKQIAELIVGSPFIRNPEATSFELEIYSLWHKVYRYLIEHREETLFMIRYRCSSLYTDEVRNMRQANTGAFDRVYAIAEKSVGRDLKIYRDFLGTCIFEMTLCYAEKIITGVLEDNAKTETLIWTAVSGAAYAMTGLPEKRKTDSAYRITEIMQ